MTVPVGELYRRIQRRETELDERMQALRATNRLLAGLLDMAENAGIVAMGNKVVIKRRILENDKILTTWEANHG
jgi:hypothetical protein